jgi:Mitochondrial ribosomal subunit S27
LEDLKNAFEKYDLEVINPKEEDRLESIAIAKLRGKGPPKKQREKDGEPDMSTEVVGMLTCNFASSVEGEKEEEMRLTKVWTTLPSDRRHPSVVGVMSRHCTKCHHTSCIEQHFIVLCHIPPIARSRTFNAPFPYATRPSNRSTSIHFHIDTCDEIPFLTREE